MKETYEQLKMDVVEFDAEDVITASTPAATCENDCIM